MSKRKRATRSRPRSKDKPQAVYVAEYEITSSSIEDRRYKRLPRHVKDAFDRLHYSAQRQPRKAIPELLEWIKLYPDIPVLYNYLSVAYSRAGQREKSEAAVRENFQRNPDYLFARLNYAEVCLAKGDYEKVAEIFEHKFDLKLLYPKRKRFHITEVANFMGLVGVYFCEIGERDAAKKYYDILKQIAPGYPMTKRLRRRLFPGLLRRLFLRLTG
jgi:tetratricopeptide (TPR) repeat protein